MTVQPKSDWNHDDCTKWCSGPDKNHNHDPACWGGEDVEHEVLLSLEDGFPLEAIQPYDPVWLRQYDQDPPRVGVYPYRAQPGYREVVYLHLYRPSDNEHRYLDSSVHLTGHEAIQLAGYLLRVAVTVDPGLYRGALLPGAIKDIAEWVADIEMRYCPRCQMRQQCNRHGETVD